MKGTEVLNTVCFQKGSSFWDRELKKTGKVPVQLMFCGVKIDDSQVKEKEILDSKNK